MNQIALLCIGVYMLLVGLISVFGIEAKGGDLIRSWAALVGGVIVVFTVITDWRRSA